MDLFQNESRPGLVAEDAHTDSKFRSLGTLRGQSEFDRIPAGGARLPVNPVCLVRGLDFLVAQYRDSFAASQIELGQGNLFIRSELTGLECDRARTRPAD